MSQLSHLSQILHFSQTAPNEKAYKNKVAQRHLDMLFKNKNVCHNFHICHNFYIFLKQHQMKKLIKTKLPIIVVTWNKMTKTSLMSQRNSRNGHYVWPGINLSITWKKHHYMPQLTEAVSLVGYMKYIMFPCRRSLRHSLSCYLCGSVLQIVVLSRFLFQSIHHNLSAFV